MVAVEREMNLISSERRHAEKKYGETIKGTEKNENYAELSSRNIFSLTSMLFEVVVILGDTKISGWNLKHMISNRNRQYSMK